jgi:peptidoglycan/xylan/chitin deacetylase (PgdA/CDA1 family)
MSPTMLETALTRISDNFLGNRFLRILEWMDRRRSNVFKVITYHHVDHPEGFRRQMAYLASHHPVVSVHDLMAAWKGERSLAPSSVLLTFDDAYRSFDEVAWPIIKELRLPVTLFVPTGFPDHPGRTMWWEQVQNAFLGTPRHDVLDSPIGPLSLANGPDRRKSLKRIKLYLKTLSPEEISRYSADLCNDLQVPSRENGVLGWDALRRLVKEGVTLGAHSRSHVLMDRIGRGEVKAEVVGSLDDLRTEIGDVLPIYCYPYGRYNDETLRTLREAGIMLAFTTRRGANQVRGSDPLQLRRVNISRCTTASVIRFRLLQSTIYLNQWQRKVDA